MKKQHKQCHSERGRHSAADRTLVLSSILEGTVIEAGGDVDPMIAFELSPGECIAIGVDRKVLEALEENILYKHCYIRASYVWDPATDEKKDFRFIELVKPKEVSHARLQELMSEATAAFAGLPDEVWVRIMKGVEE